MSVVALVLCAGASVPAQAVLPPTVGHEQEVTHINLDGYTWDVVWTRDRSVVERKLPVPADAAWTAFPAVFAELGIDPNIIDSRQMLFGNAGAVYRHDLAKQRLSHYVNCGNIIGLSSADTYEVYIRVISQVLPVDGGLSKVRTEVDAHARAVDGAEQSVPCSSTGLLESRIAKLLSQEAAKALK
jgi:hypothetical protein